MTAYIKQRAMLPELELTVSKKDPDTDVVSVVDLTLATSVDVMMVLDRRNDDDIVITGTVEDVDFENGVGKYVWQAGDTDVPGTYVVEVIVVWPGPLTEYFPTVGTATLVIDESTYPWIP